MTGFVDSLPKGIGRKREEIQTDMTVDSTVGERIRLRRRLLGLSQQQLGGSEISMSYISLIESGKRPVTDDVVALLAERLGMTSKELLDGVDPAVRERHLLALRYAEISLLNNAAQEAENLFASVLAQLTPADRDLSRQARWGIGRAQEGMGNYDGAVETLSALQADSHDLDHEPTVVEIAMAQARCHREAGDLDVSITIAEKILAAAIVTPGAIDRRLVSLLCTLSTSYITRGDLLMARKITRQALDAAENTRDLIARGHALYAASTTKQAEGRLGEALALADSAIEILDVANDVRNLAGIRTQHASISLQLPHPDLQAIRAELLNAIEGMRDVGAAWMAYAQTELARCALLEGNLDEARAIAVEAAGNAVGLERANALMIEGEIELAADHHDIGLALLRDTYDAVVDAGRSRPGAVVLRELGDLARANNQVDLALMAYGKMADYLAIAKRQRQPAPLSLRTADLASNA